MKINLRLVNVTSYARQVIPWALIGLVVGAIGRNADEILKFIKTHLHRPTGTDWVFIALAAIGVIASLFVTRRLIATHHGERTTFTYIFQILSLLACIMMVASRLINPI